MSVVNHYQSYHNNQSEQRNKQKEPIKFQSLTRKLLEARENAGNQNLGNQRCESQVRRLIENYF